MNEIVNREFELYSHHFIEPTVSGLSAEKIRELKEEGRENDRAEREENFRRDRDAD